MAFNYRNMWSQASGTDPGVANKTGATVKNPIQNTTAPRPTLPTVGTPLLSYRAPAKVAARK